MDESYEGREQSQAKHHILEHYLEKLAYKVGVSIPRLTLNYIDGFAGPWGSKTSDLSDTSPSLALTKLLKVSRDLEDRFGKTMDVRAFFVSPTAEGARKLDELRPRFPRATIEIAQKKFEDSLDDARRFAREGRNPFTFIFIDHTGWTGFGLRNIAPLLREQRRTEVVINFMTKFITRFIDSGDTRYEQSFVDLFGDRSYRDEWRGLQGLDREDRIVQAYCERIREAGAFTHCVSAAILEPLHDRTHFHLVYATHNDEGLVTFRDIERRGIDLQRDRRAGARQRSRVQKTKQRELFAGTALAGHAFEDELQARYLARAHESLDVLMAREREVSWDLLVTTALNVPMVREKDVTDWIKDRVDAGRAEMLGLGERQRVPRRGAGQKVRWKL